MICIALAFAIPIAILAPVLWWAISTSDQGWY